MDEDSIKETLDRIIEELNDMKEFLIKPKKKTGLEGNFALDALKIKH